MDISNAERRRLLAAFLLQTIRAGQGGDADAIAFLDEFWPQLAVLLEMPGDLAWRTAVWESKPAPVMPAPKEPELAVSDRVLRERALSAARSRRYRARRRPGR